METIFDIIRDFFLYQVQNPTVGFGGDAKGTMEFILVELYGVIIFSFVGYRLFKFWYQQQKEISKTLFPAMMIVLALALRGFITIMDFVIRIMTHQTYGINRKIGTMPAFALMFYFALLLSQRTIRVPRSRMKRLNNLFRANKVLIILILASVPFFVLMRYETNITQIILTLLVIPVLSYMILQLTREKRDNASKLMHIRMEMYVVGLAGLLGFTIMAFGLTLFEQIFLPNGWNIVVASALNTIMISSLVMSSLGFYWAFFIPDWVRKRHGMYSPRIFHQVQSKSL